MHLQTLFIIFVLSLAYGQDRKLTSKLNPGCRQCTSAQTLVYIRADGTEDTIHQIWDFTRGPPTIIFAIAGLNSSMSINWERTVPNNFTMNESPKYSFAASIDKVVEYNDLDDYAYLDSKSEQVTHYLKYVQWNLTDLILTEKEVMVQLNGVYHDRSASGNITVKLDILPFKDSAEELPHLIHTANSTLADISLVNFTTAARFNSSRFALHFVTVATEDSSASMDYEMRKTVDDEHTPGVFEIIEIETPETVKSGDGGFVQFRPVAYTEPTRGVSSSTNAHVSNFSTIRMHERSTLGVFYSGYNRKDLLVQAMNISFGLPGDGFYAKHNFTAWSFTVGYGSPPLEGFSLFVIIIISIGLGVPVLLALSGIVYVLIRRFRQRNAPTRFTDDE